MKIGDHMLGEGKCFIVAEIGSNHNGDFRTAVNLIKKAGECGADAVKFQVFRGDMWSSKFQNGSVKKAVTKNALNREDLCTLSLYAARAGMYFMATPFDTEAADLLYPLVPAYKIASYELTDHSLLRYVAKKRKPIILSTGMATLEEIREALGVIGKHARHGRPLKVALLHCTSCYPTDAKYVNLKAMDTLREEFKLPVGFSDHTLGLHFPIAAAARGASIIEKHLTLDPNQEGPDHIFALDPRKFKVMVGTIRSVEAGLGDGVKAPQECELDEVKMRRSLHAAVHIAKGAMITEKMLCAKRPGYGIKPRDVSALVGSVAKESILKDEWITWEMVD